MSNQLATADVLSPVEGRQARQQEVPPGVTNGLSLAFGSPPTDWVSLPYVAPGTPHGAESVNFMLTFDMDGQTGIEILPEHASPEAPDSWFPLGRLNASAEVENDTAQILLANLLVGQTTQDLELRVPAGHLVRLRARALSGPGAATLEAKVTAGGGGLRA